jgi:hypothetical protein
VLLATDHTHFGARQRAAWHFARLGSMCVLRVVLCVVFFFCVLFPSRFFICVTHFLTHSNTHTVT